MKGSDSENREALRHLMGRTRYLDDQEEPAGLLHATTVPSPGAHGRLIRLDPGEALALDPSVRVYRAADIPGQNELNPVFKDEPLLAADEWTWRGQSLALVLAGDPWLARRAAALVRVEGEEREAVTDPLEAARRGQFIGQPRTMASGDVDAAFRRGDVVTVAGRVDSAGQEHVYLETQGSIAWPLDDGGVRLLSGTQSPTGTQAAVARVLGLPMNQVSVETGRMGGAFGGKEDQANGWAALAALGARLSGKPVKLCLERSEDLARTGKRHPYATRFRLALTPEGELVAFEAEFFQNAGASADLSPAILPRTLFHAAGVYRIPNVRVTGRMCRTNLPPFTAFRGFGGPQGFFVIESALAAAAARLGVDTVELQKRNLLCDGDSFHYGMAVEGCRAQASFDQVLAKSGWEHRRAEITAFNAAKRGLKRGMAAIPVCFGISFTKLMMNQAGALVHVYADGSVGVSTGATEMGQGVNRKIALVCADCLGLPVERIKVEPTRTVTVANTQPTAASNDTDLNAMAALIACREIRGRLLDFAAARLDRPVGELGLADGRVTADGAPTPLDWPSLVAAAHEARVDLSAHAFHATPGLGYDLAAERGRPFAYHVYGAAVVSATLDTARGTCRLDEAFIVHDAGESIDPLVDRGQVEGGFAQGLGWALLEDLRFSPEGRLLSDSLSTYKLPDIHFMPAMDLEFLAGAPNPLAVANSKGVGEPPFMYGIAGYFAVLDALRAARPERPPVFDLPLSPEKILDFLDGRLEPRSWPLDGGAPWW
jgi:xanthine dehydrogenase large subunit